MARKLIYLLKKYRLNTHSLEIRGDYLVKKYISSYNSWEYRYLCEALINDTWQDWNNFCRDLIILSCNKAIATNNSIINKRPIHNNTWQQISADFKNQKLIPAVPIINMRNEPTWGDIRKIIGGIAKVHPNNIATLTKAFSQSNLNLSVYDLQIVRNCIAHKHVESVSELKLICRNNYTVNVGRELLPYELMWQETRGSPFAYFLWLDDMLTIAELAVSDSI